MNENLDYIFKILTIGDSSVGKSNLILRYIDDEYHENFLPTIGVDFKTKTIRVNKNNVRMNIWDTAG